MLLHMSKTEGRKWGEGGRWDSMNLKRLGYSSRCAGAVIKLQKTCVILATTPTKSKCNHMNSHAILCIF